MITVYGGWPTRSFRVSWALEELGVAYQLHPVDLRNRAADSEFIKVNPAGFLPAFDDGEVVMVDSVAILEYLVARYGGGKLAPGSSDPEYPNYLQFLQLGESGLAAYLNIVVASKFFAPADEKDNWGAKIAEGMFFNRLTLISNRLGSVPMMAGDSFSAADISVTYALDMADRLGLADRFGPEVQEYRKRVSARPAYKAAEAKSPPLTGGSPRP